MINLESVDELQNIKAQNWRFAIQFSVITTEKHVPVRIALTSSLTLRKTSKVRMEEIFAIRVKSNANEMERRYKEECVQSQVLDTQLSPSPNPNEVTASRILCVTPCKRLKVEYRHPHAFESQP